MLEERRRDEAGAGGEDAAVAVPRLAVHIEALRDDQRQFVARPGHRDIEEAPLLLDLFGRAGREIGGNAAVDAVEHEHRAPFLALGRMDGREDEIVLVAQRRPRLVAGRVGRVEGQFAQEALARGEGGRDAFERLEVAEPRRGVVVARLELRGEPGDGVGEFAGPGGRARRQAAHEVGEGGKPLARARAGSDKADIAAKPSSSAAAATIVSAIFGPTPRQELGDAKARHPVARVLGEAHQRERVLHMRGVEELEAAELDEGDVAAGELELERGAVVRGAEQHRLRFQRGARLAVGEHAGRDEARLIGLLGDGDQRGRRSHARGRSTDPWRSARARAR